MGVADAPVPGERDHTVDGELVATIESLEEGDLLVNNGDTRTW
jgi:hypothetical protein